MKEANYGPVYCALYPELAEIAREHGYALAIHGSLARDMDLVCVPWGEEVAAPQLVVDVIVTRFALRVVGEPDIVVHGRQRWSLSIGHGHCAIDLSFVPRWSKEGSQDRLDRDALEVKVKELEQVLDEANCPRKYVRVGNSGVTYCLHGTSSISAFDSLAREHAALQFEVTDAKEELWRERYVCTLLARGTGVDYDRAVESFEAQKDGFDMEHDDPLEAAEAQLARWHKEAWS